MKREQIYENIKLKENQRVEFTDFDGTKYKADPFLEKIRWSEEHNAWFIYTDTDTTEEITLKNGEVVEERARIFSNTVCTLERRKKSSKNKENCTVCIKVHHETEKSYAVFSGSNGSVINPREWYCYIAKSICKVEDGKVYAPSWAVKDVPLSEIL